MRPHPLTELARDFCLCLTFFSRLPCPFKPASGAHGLGDFSRAIRMLPWAGAATGALGAVSLAAAFLLGLPPILAAPLAVSTLVVVSGALHEDGLADCADGFFGGTSRARKLEIMRDSRIGTFGATALMLSLYMRAASLTAVAGQGLLLACAVLVAAAAISRTAALMPLRLLPPARADGTGSAAGTPGGGALCAAICGALFFAAVPAAASASLARALAAIGLAIAAALAVTALASRQIGGQTGDVAGAAQQLSEIAVYLVFAAQV